MTTVQVVRAAAGDTVELSGRRVGDHARTGTIVDVLGEPEHPHYLVHWEDGHESVLYPGEATTVRPGLSVASAD